ncbi:MAG: hypothetical protein LBG83_08285 [Oscillospiraceae bacterium]|jgi:hypothetical protein|nr:hypothetical protein [Oscillospiraceae bacterium]
MREGETSKKPKPVRLNRRTKARARHLLRGHKRPAALLLLAGAALAAGAGFLPLLLDFAAVRASALLPPAAPALGWGKVAAGVLLTLAAVACAAPLRLGREAWFFGGADGRKRTATRVFFWLQPRWALKAMRFVLALAVRRLLWAAVYLLPGGFLLGGTVWQLRAGGMHFSLALCAAAGGAALLLLGLGFYLLTVQRYALVLPILVKQPKCKLRNALRLSAARTEGQCAALLRFQLSFAPWYLLSLLALPLVYSAPYVTQAKACRCAELLSGKIGEES